MLAEMKTFVRKKIPPKIKNGPAKNLKFIAPYNYSYIAGSIEVYVQEAIKQHLKHGDVFFDIGANIGFFSVLGANIVGEQGRVIAFEPVPANVQAIQKNIEVNKFSNTTIIDKAVSDNTAPQDIYIPKNLAGATLTSLGIKPPDAETKMTVKLVSIDELILDKSIPPPQFVKIDVEGAEKNVFKSMTETIKKYRPIILYEVDSDNLTDLTEKQKQLDGFMKNKGYRLEHLQNSYPDIKWHVAHTLAFPQRGDKNE